MLYLRYNPLVCVVCPWSNFTSGERAGRDFDRALFQSARQRGLPILGICYGMQLMVESRGGVLEPHLPSRPERPGENSPDEHKLSDEDALRHFCVVALNLNEFVYLD